MTEPPPIDPRIERLASTTFFGKRLTRRQIADIQETVALFPKLSRNELGHTLCEHLNWKTPRGRNRIQLAVRLLEELERLSILTLPPKQHARRNPNKPVPTGERSEPGPVIDAPLADLQPLRLETVTEAAGIAAWNEWVQRQHPLGYRRPVGVHLRYFLRDRQGRLLGCLLFDFAARELACRDAWIGWQGEAHRKRLQLVVRNARYLLFPWVRVKNLASHALGLARRQLPPDWQRQHGYRPVLLETYIDPQQHAGTCYKAANWQYLGLTRGSQAQAGRPSRRRRCMPARCGRTGGSCCWAGPPPWPGRAEPRRRGRRRPCRRTASWRCGRRFWRRRRVLNTLLC